MSNKREATFHPMDPSEAGDLSFPEPERETVGDWAGHTPAGVEPATKEWTDEDAKKYFVDQARHDINDGIRALVTVSGENSRDHGFHDDFPSDTDLDMESDRDFQKAVVEKLALIHEEISETLGEIRSGRGTHEIYFVDKKGVLGTKGEEFNRQLYQLPDGSNHPESIKRDGDVPLLKPEGFLVELADATIRISDLVFLVHARETFVKALAIKHEYNATRPYKHGRKF